MAVIANEPPQAFYRKGQKGFAKAVMPFPYFSQKLTSARLAEIVEKLRNVTVSEFQ